MNRKVTLLLILGLVLVGFIVAPVAASAAFALPNGDCWGESDGFYGFYYHSDTGITDIWHTNPLKGNGLAIYQILKVAPGYTNSYSNSLLSKTKPSPVIVKPLPVQGTIKTIPVVNYEPVSSSFVPYPSATLTTPDSEVPFSPPIVYDDDHQMSTDLLLYLFPEYRPEGYSESGYRSFWIENRVLKPEYMLGVRGQSIGDIVQVSVIVNPEIKSEIEPFFYEVTGIESWPGDPLTIWGWIPLNKIKKLSDIEGVYEIRTVWPPTLSEVSTNPSETQSTIFSSSIKQVIIPSQSISKLHQTGITSSGASRFTQYIK
jgi:hypothetical protein